MFSSLKFNFLHVLPYYDIIFLRLISGDEQLAQDFFDLALKVERVIQILGFPGSDSPEHSDEPLELRRQSGVTSTSDVQDQELATKYISSLRELQFDSCDIDG